jgi:hypothetical protein
LRTAATYEAEPAMVLARLNAALATDEDRRQLCTAICAQVVPDLEGGRARVRLACAGHLPPFLLRGDELPRLAGRPGALLGVRRRRLHRRRHRTRSRRRSSSTPTASPTPAARRSASGQERLAEF